MKIDKEYFYKRPFLSGLIFGSIVCISQMNLKYGIPVSLLFLIFFNFLNLNIFCNLKIKFLIIIKLLIISLISLTLSNKEPYNIIQILSIDIIIFIILSFKKFDNNFIKGMLYPLIILFFCDLLYNINYLISSYNLKNSMRPGDFIPRTPGILNSPIFSVNISFILFVYSLYFREKILCVISFLASIATGALRAPLIFSIYLGSIIIIKYKIRGSMIILFSIIFIGSLYLLVNFHSNANSIEECRKTWTCESFLLNGSALRIAAWKNAAQIILNHPLHGYQDFIQRPFDNVDPESIINRGIAESMYLQYMVDWGVLVGLIHFLILLIIFCKKRTQFLQKSSTQYEKLITTSLAFTCLLDTFFDSLFSSFIVLVYIGILIIYMPNEVNKTNPE